MISEIILDHDTAGIIKGRFLAIKQTVASTSVLYFACRTRMSSVLSSRRDMSSNAKVFKLASASLKVSCLRLLFRCRAKWFNKVSSIL